MTPPALDHILIVKSGCPTTRSVFPQWGKQAGLSTLLFTIWTIFLPKLADKSYFIGVVCGRLLVANWHALMRACKIKQNGIVLITPSTCSRSVNMSFADLHRGHTPIIHRDLWGSRRFGSGPDMLSFSQAWQVKGMFHSNPCVIQV